MNTNINGRKCLFELKLMLMLTFCLGSVHSIIMPPRLHSSKPEPPLLSPDANEWLSDDATNPNINNIYDDTVPYLLTINQGDRIDVKVRSQSNITINLNRAVPKVDVIVTITVFSGPGLIGFDNAISNNTSVRTGTSVTVVYKADTFGDRIVTFYTKDDAGHAKLVCKVTKKPDAITIDDSSAYISINISKNGFLSVIIDIVGWMYFVAWSMSFYFQVILNYQRKSVVGLNFDFLGLNLLGFACYSIYNFTLMFSSEVQKDYYERNVYSRIPVEYNDLFFSIHAFLVTLITIIQCFIYERGEQKFSMFRGLFVVITSLLGLGLYMYITSLFHPIAILDLVLYLSYVKLIVTVIKYTPQAYMNYQRKTTTGWSIHNILLDFTGGALSLAQMFLLAYNYDDWISIFGNFTKFGLGIISIFFDLVFVVQHYIFYKQVGELEVSQESIPSPVINQSIRSMSYRQQPDEQNDQ